MVTLDREKDRVIAESIGFLARLPYMAEHRRLKLVSVRGRAIDPEQDGTPGNFVPQHQRLRVRHNGGRPGSRADRRGAHPARRRQGAHRALRIRS